MKNVIVFCGARESNDPAFSVMAADLGGRLASAGVGVVYGGACIGLMGIVADAALAAGGHVTGVIPGFMSRKEIAHTGLTELFIVDSMHERKFKMFEMGDAVVALPGGWGTMDELFEMLTWKQIGLHNKPVVLLNFRGFYDHLLAQCAQMVASGFLQHEVMDELRVANSVDEFLSFMLAD